MNKVNFGKRAATIGLCLCMAMSSITVYAVEVPAAAIAGNPDGGSGEEKDYIVMTGAKKQADDLEQRYDCPYVVNANSGDCLQENQMASLTLTDREAEKLSSQTNVAFVEEDIVVTASHTSAKNNKQYTAQTASMFNKGDRKKSVVEKVQKDDSEEWNLRMIHADRARKLIPKKRKKEKDDRVRIAILDSGVDYNTDMNIAATFSLVPGEEDMNPLFMDATGHGTSVAGLAAAKDNGEGITGVDPYAEIYSIRVLDDDNCSPISRIIEGIYMAIDAKADIINMSFGVSTYSQALAQAVRDAEDAGILVIAAAGNTGPAGDTTTESTVQYPAALDGVLAIGSVDKRGELADSSATGSEINLMAPGELVRSTGMFGSGEIVESGTSLAAPQAAGAAALILEKDKAATPDFVRNLLMASANAYGEADEYGAGLIDVGYALKHYDSFKKQYKEKKVMDTAIPENDAKVPVFQNTGCVKGCWSRDNHEALVKSSTKYVKKGARFNDDTAKRYITGKDENGDNLYRYQGMKNNPWWHGYYKKEKKGNYLCNYVAAYVYITRRANAMKTGASPKHTGLSDKIKKEIDDDISKIDWKTIFGKVPSKSEKRQFLWGMAIHSLTDAFAHSSTVKGKRIVHTKKESQNADNINYYPERWKCASKAATNALTLYNSPNAAGSWSNFYPVRSQDQFKLINIYENVKSTFGEGAAEYFKTKSQTMK